MALYVLEVINIPIFFSHSASLNTLMLCFILYYIAINTLIHYNIIIFLGSSEKGYGTSKQRKNEDITPKNYEGSY